MAKIVELESGTNPVEEVTDPKQKAKNETEEMIQRLMKKAYVLGLSAGMKTMCGSILEKMNQNKNLNPQKQLMLLRQWCNRTIWQLTTNRTRTTIQKASQRKLQIIQIKRRMKMMRKSQSNSTILTEKAAQLDSLMKDSENAVSVITTTIDRLANVNARINSTRQEIESYKAELERLDGSMEQQFSHNAKIIEKFKNFLED